MRRLLASLAITFSTYSRIPMPQVEWSEDNMRHTLSLLPLVGLVIGALYCLTDRLSALLGFSPLLRAALLTVLPVLVTGGIHLDGYCDTVDALASHAPREKKLAILKDSSAGGLRRHLVLRVVSADLCPDGSGGLCPHGGRGLRPQPDLRRLGHPAPALRPGGHGGHPEIRQPVPLVGPDPVSGSSGAALVLLWGDLIAGGAALIVMIVFYFIYRAMALREFGGFTGDLAGWFIQVGELGLLAAVVLAERGAALWL